MTTQFIPSIVVLSVLVAILASYVALNLAHTVTEAKGKAQILWLSCGALAMGVGIWSMHFVGMLAFEMPGMEMAYDVPIMILSVVVAIGGSALALYVVSRPTVTNASILSGGIAMAAAISGMHYLGMYSMRMAARTEWNMFYVALSIVIALLASFAALYISVQLRHKPERSLLQLAASSLMGLAIAGMHYMGMIAATFIHDDSIKIESKHLLVTSGLTISVVSTTILILGLALAGSIWQRLWALRVKLNEDILNSSEEKFRMLIEAVKDYSIMMLDPEGRITTWNTGAQRITGYTDREVIGKFVSIFYTQPDIDAQIAKQELKIALEQGHFENEGIRVRKDGTTFWANLVITPLFDRNGVMKGFSKVTRDITELRAAAEKMRTINVALEDRVLERTIALQTRESQLRSITNALPVLVAQFDINQQLLFANDSFCEWFGIRLDQQTGNTFFNIMGENSHIPQVLLGESFTYEYALPHAGRTAILTITCVPEYADAEKSRPKGIIVVASDVSMYKEIQSELNAAKEAAEVANATKSAFLANMSHEIRTPLGAVLGFSELMLGDDITQAEKISSFEIIKRNGKLLSDIINDILDLSKVEAGKLQIEIIDVEVAPIVNEIATLLGFEAQGKGIKLTVTTEGAVPTIVKTDPTRLRQILFNIIGNAVKFTERGSVDIKLQLTPGTNGTKLAFVVTDTGSGIKREQVSSLFAPFVQADVTMTRKFGGTGLGLVLAKKLANALGGDVVLMSTTPGQGSTFVITINPGESRELLFDNSPESLRNGIHLVSPAETKNLNGMTALVVDDSPDNQALVKRLLTILGVKVELANNGREAVQKACAAHFDVVLMDLQMPVMDGYEATRELRSLGYTLPVIAFTAHAMKDERKKCMDAGFNDFLTKPVDRETLLRTLSHYTGTSLQA